MKTFVTAAGLAMGASAAVLGRSSDQCCFNLDAQGGESGYVGQLGDGQNRIGGNYGTATYCINNGQITDQQGRGCILTAPTTQFQCDAGATPTGGFSISCSGLLEHNGDSTFYACPASAGGPYNIYTQPVSGQPKCTKITLSTGGKCATEQCQTSTCSTETMTMTQTEQCTPSTMTYWKTQYETEVSTEMCTPSTEYKTVYQTEYKTNEEYETKTVEMTEYETKTMQETVTAESPTTVWVYKTEYKTEEMPTTVYEYKTEEMTEYQTEYKTEEVPTTVYETVSKATQTAESTCPAELNGEWQYPHLIVPVSSEHPDMSYGTQYDGMCNSTMSTYFNFDVPSSYQGKTCNLIFMLPMKNQLETSSYNYNGEGKMQMWHSDSVCSEKDSWNTAPKGTMMGSWAMSPGNAYTMWSGECMAGTTQSYEMSAEGGMNMWYFQDYNPCPLGLYMTTSD